MTITELAKELNRLPIGHRRTLISWGRIIANGINDRNTSNPDNDGEGVFRVIGPGPNFDPRRRLLLLPTPLSESHLLFNPRSLDEAKRIVHAVNDVAGEEIVRVLNDDRNLGSSAPTEVELKYYIIIRIRCELSMLTGACEKLSDRPADASGVKRAITRDLPGGEYFFRGKPILFNKKSIHFHIFEFLYDRPDGEATYAEIDAYIASQGSGSMVGDPDKLKQRIKNAIKVYEKNKKLPQKIGKKDLFTINWGKGIRLNNPEISN